MNKIPFDLSALKDFKQIDQLEYDFFQFVNRKKFKIYFEKILIPFNKNGI